MYLLSYCYFYFTFIFHQQLYKFPIIGRFLGNFSPWRHTYAKGWNTTGYAYSRTNNLARPFGSHIPGPPGE